MAREPSFALAVAAAAALFLGACGSKDQKAAARWKVDPYASREPGSDVAPTNDASFQLLGADGPTRFASLQALIVQNGKACGAVRRAVLEGGLEGTDEWRVDCADSGRWQVWFRPDSAPDVDHCANTNCT